MYRFNPLVRLEVRVGVCWIFSDFHTHPVFNEQYSAYHNILNCKSSVVVLEEVIFCIYNLQYFRYWGNSLAWSIHNMQIHITPWKWKLYINTVYTLSEAKSKCHSWGLQYSDMDDFPCLDSLLESDGNKSFKTFINADTISEMPEDKTVSGHTWSIQMRGGYSFTRS